MANTSSVCASCLRAIRTQSIFASRQRLVIQSSRALSTTRTRYVEPSRQAPKPTASSNPPPPPKEAEQPSRDALSSFARQLRSTNTLRAATEPLVAYGVTEDLFAHCQKQCTYTVPSLSAKAPSPAPKNAAGEDIGEGSGFWFAASSPHDVTRGLGLDVTFNSWAQVQYLHLYLLSVRFRRFPKEHTTIWQQHILDHFFYAAEDRMATYHGMAARGVRNKNLKDLWLQWRGVLLSYDEGLIRGDAVLAGAVWRNLFKGRTDVELEKVAAVVGYLRRQMAYLEGLSDQQVAEGKVDFGDAGEIIGKLGLSRESPWMKRPFSPEDLQALKEAEQK
ncbi:Hypothetical protein R9X50_00590700 [Acrodontium crateriforme]|uniref:Ubiquinol-cytochrome c chaperone domain-containing protein n=1 Tax=Acrodontium crateriforme TaxID=150365 RepID=A0AAQ3M8Y2_9PEZI|nr:Hypothetical protein R9X50_00590700 [Acrodontium crateriforme]